MLKISHICPKGNSLAWVCPIRSFGVLLLSEIYIYDMTYARSQREELPVAKVMRKEARHMQRWDRASGVPLEILEHLPPNQSLPTLLLCALTYTSDFTGGCPPPPLSEKELTQSSS